MRQFNTLTGFLTSKSSSPTANDTVIFQGYAAIGDGGAATWQHNGVTGQTPSQSPAQLGDALLNDGNGNQWSLVKSGVVLLEALGFTGSGDETLTMQAAINGADDGSTIKCLKKGSFENDGLTFSDKSLTFDFLNSDMDMKTVASAISAAGSYRDQQSVSLIAVVVTGVSTVTVSDGAAYSRGDIVKIVSTDEQPDYWTANRFLGQFAVIDLISGNDLQLDRLIVDAPLYLTSVTLAVINNHTCRVKNLNIKGPDLTDNFPVIVMKDMINPSINNVTINDSKDTCFQFRSCYKYLLYNCEVKNALSNSGAGNFGYSVADASCEGGYVFNLLANGCRHGFTNNSHEASGGSLDLSCGYTTNTQVVNSVAHNAKAGGWDTHTGAIRVSFINCKTFSSASFGQSRSRFTTFLNPYGRDNQSGIKFTTGKLGSTINPIKENRIINPDIQSREAFIEHYLQSGTTIGLTDVSEIIVEGGSAEMAIAGYRGPLLESRTNPIKFTISDFSLNLPEGADTDALILLAGVDFNDISTANIAVKSPSTSVVGGATGLIKFLASVVALDHTVIVDSVTFKGDAWIDKDMFAAQACDALVSNIKVEKITTGSLTAVGGGTSLTWGAII